MIDFGDTNGEFTTNDLEATLVNHRNQIYITSVSHGLYICRSCTFPRIHGLLRTYRLQIRASGPFETRLGGSDGDRKEWKRRNFGKSKRAQD